ncbi:NAD(P)-dependent dehydrogenase, short-chain alcohol dehydrogenase family [Streptoalloteichus tenebrarius]|uniref:NAD(P)-dependent dehydrogenase, short-chain alcohol dehydrogenase family n=1 Tax=Streptoalloteichus tenebrarius (strain ATCC 17920 / DSM 40477 / JCM 4838 / CBS 697.72 / NBRC 16177 / NCIMB 11028 / NRRL B-12390 / A12253. 1 / ISP 5477) TaxID=1933 RepID=A0ABT1I3C2_STRSD|nr:SDR family NAD(P)-dependent oxidoreductase [Streptoalloteichus tenebrarius]MCP2262239.1 NAD(P)-dependent dehydrogenase, short-chain alcohol dehydrogenase family [Streptoalloteichus tenebrarius]BFF00782.1 SDR family oxidoreductase [Streptoalloteichus tenebrarius]
MTRRAVLVTGASGGIGAAIARAFADAGDQVVLHYASGRERAEELLATLPGDGHHAVGADITDPDGARHLVEATVEAVGRLDVLVNNAGVSRPHHPVLESSYEDWQAAWQRMVAVNLTGPANVIHRAVQHMRDRGGRIINVGSRGAYRGTPLMPAYAATKAGLHALGQTLALSLAQHGISVTAVAPGVVDAGMAEDLLNGPDADAVRAQSPFGRVATAEEVAHAVLYLASPQAEFASGTVIDVNGASYLRA